MTTDIMLAIALGASIILNAMQASKAQEWRNKVKDLLYQIDILTRPIEDDEAVHTFNPADRYPRFGDEYIQVPDDTEPGDDWLARHPGPQPKPGYERKRR